MRDETQCCTSKLISDIHATLLSHKRAVGRADEIFHKRDESAPATVIDGSPHSKVLVRWIVPETLHADLVRGA